MHKADRIIDTVTALLNARPEFVGGAARARAYPHEEDQLPAASVYMGVDDPEALDSGAFDVIDSRLQVRIQIAAVGRPEDADAELLRLRRVVTLALMADYRLGLPFVIQTREGRADEPEISTEGRRPVVWQQLTYYVDYRRSAYDPAQ